MMATMMIQTLSELYPDLRRLRFGSIVYALLTDTTPENQQHRIILDAALREAGSRGWLTPEVFGRLRAGDDAVVLSILDELLIAQALDRANYSLQFNPPGEGRHVGELLIERGDLRSFIEVKSLLPAEAVVLAQTTLARLRDLASTIPLAARLTLEITHHPNSGISHREVRRYLHVAAEQMLSGWTHPAAYTHSSGIYLRPVDCQPLPEAEHLQIDLYQEEYPGLARRAHRAWCDRLWRAIRGGYTQLPAGEPAVIIVVDHAQPAPPLEAWLAPLGDMLRMGAHHRLSAVIRIELASLRTGLPALTIFHNPRASSPLVSQPILGQHELHISMLNPETW